MARPTVPDARWLWDNEPCRAACPVHTDAGAYVTAIAEGRFRDAYLIARAPNPFASICGRVCAAPCETACRRGTVDAPVAIRALKRFVTERFGVESFAANSVWHEAHGPVPPPTLGSVGVIGGGPAGLAAAYELRLAGHPVTVYEAADRLGGMMVLGIPEYRLARGLIAREIDAILELGIDVELVVPGRPRRDARRSCSAATTSLFLAVGTGRGRDLDLPGHELDGVLRAVEFLLNVNRGFQVDLGERVVVVGGGNVAFDAARTALRAAAGEPRAAPSRRAPAPAAGTPDDARRGMTTTLDVARAAVRAGVLDVTVIALESPEEIPADPEEIAEAEAEGITILYRKGPHRFVGERRARHRARDDRRARRCSTTTAASTRPSSPGTEAVLPADTVILAVGQAADLDVLGGRRARAEPRAASQVDPDHAADLAPADLGRRRRRPRPPQPHRRHRRRPAGRGRPSTPSSGRRCRPPTAVHVELQPAPGFRRLSTGYDAIDRQPVPATPTRPPDRLRRGRGRLRRPGRLARVAALPALLRQRHARPEPLHPVRPLRRRLPDRTASPSPAPTTSASATRRRACCCSTRTCASAAGSASTAARPARCRWSTRGRSVDD